MLCADTAISIYFGTPFGLFTTLFEAAKNFYLFRKMVKRSKKFRRDDTMKIRNNMILLVQGACGVC